MRPPDVRGAGSRQETGPLKIALQPSLDLDGASRAHANADDWWRDCAMRAMRWMAELGQPFDAWDLIQLGVPEPDDPHRWGGLFRTAARRGLIEAVGYAPSRRPTAAGSIARVWRGSKGDA